MFVTVVINQKQLNPTNSSIHNNYPHPLTPLISSNPNLQWPAYAYDMRSYFLPSLTFFCTLRNRPYGKPICPTSVPHTRCTVDDKANPPEANLDEEMIQSVDQALHDMDLDSDGFIDWSEYVHAHEEQMREHEKSQGH